MCRRQAREAQSLEPLRRPRSLTARGLLPLAEKQQRVLRDLRRLESLGVVSASDGYQALVDELAKVTAGPGVRVCTHTCVCACTCTCVRSIGTSRAGLSPMSAHPKLSPRDFQRVL